jgi:hypothetical protein
VLLSSSIFPVLFYFTILYHSSPHILETVCCGFLELQRTWLLLLSRYFNYSFALISIEICADLVINYQAKILTYKTTIFFKLWQS